MMFRIFVDTQTHRTINTTNFSGKGERSMDDIEKFGEIIFRARGRRTQEEFGQLFDVRGVYVGKWENSTRFPSKHLLPKIAQVTGEKLSKLTDLIRYETEKDREIKEILKDRLIKRYYTKTRRRGKKEDSMPPQLESETLYFRGRTYQPGDKEWAIVEKIISELETD